MKRCLLTVMTVTMVVMLVPSLMHTENAGQPTIFTNAKPMTFGQNLKMYYMVQKGEILDMADKIPEDKFFALPPGCTKETCKGEQASIGGELAHLADTNDRMGILMLTGKDLPASSRGGTVVMKSGKPTKAELVAALKKSFDVTDQLVDNFDDAKITAMVNSQHALQPFGTTLFNVISFDRQQEGKVSTLMASFGLPGIRSIAASDPANKEDLYLCGGQASKDPSICTTSK